MKKILVIEDQPQMRKKLVRILEMENFAPLEAADGRAGLALARAQLPDLILCDVMMPELDGYEVLRQLRADAATAAIPFIFLTARGDRTELRAGMNLGADDYLTKPVAVDDLLAAITARLRRNELRGPGAPNFTSHEPLQKLGLTPREAEVLLWIAQGKTNEEAAMILGLSAHTVRKHLEHVFRKLGVENRMGACLRAIEVLSGSAAG